MVVEVVIIFCRLCSILRLEIWQVYAHLTWTIHLTNYHFHIISRSRVQSFTYCYWLWHCKVSESATVHFNRGCWNNTRSDHILQLRLMYFPHTNTGRGSYQYSANRCIITVQAAWANWGNEKRTASADGYLLLWWLHDFVVEVLRRPRFEAVARFLR